MLLKFCIPCCAIFLMLGSPHARGADQSDPDWPCVQRKVPTISAGMIWAGPPIDEKVISAWSADETISRLVPRLAARRTELEEAGTLIKTFASGLSPSARGNQLTLLFTGVLTTINSERRQIMAGIERYTRKQRELAQTVRGTRDKLNAVLKIANLSNADKKRRRELEEALNWQSRIHDERVKSLKFVCESPVLLEQRAFAIARTIMNHLE